MGGVVDVKSRNPKTDGFHGVVEVNAYNANVVLETPITDTLSIAAAYRRSYIDLVLPLFLKDDSPSFTVAPRYDDAQLKLTWKPNAKNTFQFLGLHSQDALQLITKTSVAGDPTLGRDFKNETGFNQARLRHTFVDDAWRVDTVAGFDRTEVDPEHRRRSAASRSARAPGRCGAPPSPRRGLDHPVGRRRLDLHPRHLPRRAGAGATRRRATVLRPAAEILYADSPFWQSQLGICGPSCGSSPVPQLLIIPGVRLDLVSIRLQHTPLVTADPRLAVRWSVLPPLTLKMGVGSTMRRPRSRPARWTRRSATLTSGADTRCRAASGAEWNIRPTCSSSVEGLLQPALRPTGQHQRHHRAERPARAREPGQ